MTFNPESALINLRGPNQEPAPSYPKMSENLRRRLDSDDRGCIRRLTFRRLVLRDTRFWGMIGSGFFYPKSFLSENMSVKPVTVQRFLLVVRN